MQTSGRAERNPSCRRCTSLGKAPGREVIMYQSTDTEQLNRPQLRGTMSVIMKSGRREDRRLLLKTPSFDWRAGSISKHKTTEYFLSRLSPTTDHGYGGRSKSKAVIQVTVGEVRRGRRNQGVKLCVLRPSVANSQKEHHHEKEERQDVGFDHYKGNVGFGLNFRNEMLHGFILEVHPPHDLRNTTTQKKNLLLPNGFTSQ